MGGYDAGPDQYDLIRMHKRRDRSSTKVGNNTYARHERLVGKTSGDRVIETWKVTITYHDTDIITCTYKTLTSKDVAVLDEIMRLKITDGGWDTVTTWRRINQFLSVNQMGLMSYKITGKRVIRPRVHPQQLRALHDEDPAASKFYVEDVINEFDEDTRELDVTFDDEYRKFMLELLVLPVPPKSE